MHGPGSRFHQQTISSGNRFDHRFPVPDCNLFPVHPKLSSSGGRQDQVHFSGFQRLEVDDRQDGGIPFPSFFHHPSGIQNSGSDILPRRHVQRSQSGKVGGRSRKCCQIRSFRHNETAGDSIRGSRQIRRRIFQQIGIQTIPFAIAHKIRLNRIIWSAVTIVK